MKTFLKHLLSLLVLLVLAASVTAGAETIKVGSIKSPTSAGILAIGLDKGYFMAEGLTAETVSFETAQPVAVAVASRSIDFGITGLTAAFYSLAGQGQLRIVGGYLREYPTFHSTAYVVSNAAYAAGLKSFKDFAGHSVALPVLGSPPHYSLGLLAAKYGFDLKSMRLLQLQTNPNQLSAVVGGQADIGLIAPNAVLPAIQKGDVKLLGWVGDETPWQLGAIAATAQTADERGDMVKRFLRAYAKATSDYRAAFVGPDGRRHDNASAPEILTIIAKALGMTNDQVALGIGYADPQLDEKDILRQIAWYKSQGMLKPDVDGNKIIDARYVMPIITQ